ncbi:MAG: type II toxin-antitoxin system RelE/ParE family toxin [Calditrichaeota bacterium]|nr:type II toxin-antitoxin system RelE/ParE family toxin [Calditrichota bacterium]
MNVTVVELPEFIRKVVRLLDEDERNSLIFYLSLHPKSGSIIKGTGGIRKLRWGRKGKGKSGGVRVIYFFHSDEMPLFLLTVFGKSEKDNLSKAEKNELERMVKLLEKTYKRKK